MRQNWLLKLAASRRFQCWATRVPGLKRIARAEGAALFDIAAGFVNSQVLMALIDLRIPHILEQEALFPKQVADLCAAPPERMQVLLQAGAGLGLLRRYRNGQYGLAVRGASLLGVPGLEAIVKHHRVLYADLVDPAEFIRGGQNTELARFWPYVFGAAGATDPTVAATYSNLMAESQILVAEDTLRRIDLTKTNRLLDVGGGSGAFLKAVGVAYPKLKLSLFDLPAVLDDARQRLFESGLSGRVSLHSGSFQDDTLPKGADAISLIRVLYDHSDSTIRHLLSAVYAALPPDGQLIISEPMSGGDKPERSTDVYFAIYTLAMQTGRTRSPEEIGRLLASAGFSNIRNQKVFRPFVTSVIVATRG